MMAGANTIVDYYPNLDGLRAIAKRIHRIYIIVGIPDMLRTHIRYVLCAGEVLLRDGKTTRVNAAEVIANTQSVADWLWARARSA
ncbi:MAG: hypothetical protein ACJAUZ_001560 [Flavobacteriaceae bacterium]|jgi:hypothetical protein